MKSARKRQIFLYKNHEDRFVDSLISNRKIRFRCTCPSGPDPWLNDHNYHCGSLNVMELLSIFAQNKELAVAKWNEYFGNSEMLEED